MKVWTSETLLNRRCRLTEYISRLTLSTSSTLLRWAMGPFEEVEA